MKLQLLSDIHMEMHRDQGYGFIDSLNPDGVDVLVMAGDIMYLNFYDNVKNKLEKLLEKYKRIIYVVGNHEFYTSSIDTVKRVVERVREVLPEDRISIVIEPRRINIEGQDFLCGPMWYRDKDGNNKYFEDLMNDKHYIRGFLPTWVYGQNLMFEHLVNGQMTKNDIVVTHYLPSHQCVHPYYKNSSLNRFFVCEMDELILDRKPKLWLFGHTHSPIDTMIGETRVVCNPHGYPRETSNGKFNEKLIIEV